MLYRGSCHCGENAYEVEGEIGQVVECNCSYCTRKGYLLWFVPRNHLRLTTPETRLAIYTFNKHVIKHHFCPECGCSPFGLGGAPINLLGGYRWPGASSIDRETLRKILRAEIGEAAQ